MSYEMDDQKQIEKEIYYKTKLSDGRFIGITPTKNRTNEEYIFIVGPNPNQNPKIPALLIQSNSSIQIFSKIADVYLTTEINKEDVLIIRNLIKYTDLNKYSLLFGEIYV